MKPGYWQFRLTGLLLLILTFKSSLAQVDTLAGTPINIASDINQEALPLPLGDKVNSNYVEAGPLIGSNGKRLYYSRYGHPLNTGGAEDTDIWYNEFDDSTQSWNESINIGAPLNNAGPNFVCEVGWTDDTVMVANRYNKKGKMKAGVSLSVWNGKSWSVPTPIQIKNDYNMAENVGYDLSSYRNVIVIAEEKIDSHGKTDLYVAFRDRSTRRTTTESFNLGAVINSVGSERSPFLTDDTKTIYFASDGHNGYGKLDVFRSHRLDDTWTNWSTPENLGPGINTPYDDRNFTFGSTSRHAYYSRGVTHTRSDIHSIALSSLFVVDVSINDLSERTTSSKPGETFTLREAFVAGQPVLTESALEDLKNVVAYTRRLRVQILFLDTHSDPHAKRSESLALSNQRLEEVKKYLIGRGVDQTMLQGESHGHDIAKTDSMKYLSNSLEFRFINKVIVRTPAKRSD